MRTRLQHRQVHCPSIYPLCTEEEDDWHVLFTCDTSCSCWEQAGLTSFLQQRKQHFSSVIEVIMDICSVEEKSVAGHVAMVISGTFVTAATSWKANRVSVIEGEAAALPEAMQFARTSGRHNVIDAMSLNYAGVSEFSMLISSIKNLLNLCPNFEVKFVRRQTNMVAQTLVKAAICYPSHHVFEFIPLCIESMVNNEMTQVW
ncbi:BZIP-like protein [Trifolium pratense]|uniref:BZIP-like protein n=1 Tax=Trifolium pratense TaxID=57577 RepID=A0A2K3P077_TRIPR|nr:BZIP-like protein [Trifolium pratense]